MRYAVIAIPLLLLVGCSKGDSGPIGNSASGDTRDTVASQQDQLLVAEGPMSPKHLPDSIDRVVLVRHALGQYYAPLVDKPSDKPVTLWFLADSTGKVLRHLQTQQYRHVGRDELEAAFPGHSMFQSGEWMLYTYPLGAGRRDIRVMWVESNRKNP